MKAKIGIIAGILLDLEMPVMNGFAFLEEKDRIPGADYIPVVVVTADETNTAQIRVLDHGVVDIIRKPYHPKIVCKRVQNVVAMYGYREILEGVVETKEKALKEKEKELATINESLIDALSSVVEFRDVETGEHVQRIKTYTRILCETMMNNYPECGLTNREVDLIVSASAMHDIGKIAIPDAILLKPGRLTPEEFDVFKLHTIKGEELLERVNFLTNGEYMKYCKNICLYHHEKYDGKGYPKGLKEEEIPLEAQIVSIADVFDALVSKRIYKDSYSAQNAFDMIMRGECGLFSERLLDCFSKSFSKFLEVADRSYKAEKEGI